MRKLFIFAVTVVLGLGFLSSCSSKAQITVNEYDAEYLAEVYGGDDFIELVPGTYDVVEKKGAISTTIPLKITKGKRLPNCIVEEFILLLTNAEDKYIKIGENKVELSALNPNEVYAEICKADVGAEVPVTFQYKPVNSKDLKGIMEAIVSCEVELSIEEQKKEKAKYSNINDDVDDIYNEAMKEASDMYEKAQKQAEEMYEKALEDASIW